MYTTETAPAALPSGENSAVCQDIPKAELTAPGDVTLISQMPVKPAFAVSTAVVTQSICTPLQLLRQGQRFTRLNRRLSRTILVQMV